MPKESPTAAVLPPEERFWKRHSPRYEFSISFLASLTVQVALFLLFFLIVAKLMQMKVAKNEIPFKTLSISDLSGDDDIGSKGSGGGERVEKSDVVVPETAAPDTPVQIEKIKVAVSEWTPDLKNDADLQEVIAMSPNRTKLENLDKGIRQALLEGLNNKPGKGANAGSGTTGQTGSGVGGDGEFAKSRKRALGWVLQFDTRDTRNYLDQLAAMKATLLFRPDHRSDLDKAIAFTDISKGAKPRKYDASMNLGGLYFVDDAPHSVRGVSKELGLDFIPPEMIAFFPKDVEEELAQKSIAYKGRREEDIAQTTFSITVIGGKYDIKVTGQIAKRR